MRLLLWVPVVLLAAVTPAHAELLSLSVRTCPNCWDMESTAPDALLFDAVLDVERITSGQVWSLWYNSYFGGVNQLEVTSISGSFNGDPLSLITLSDFQGQSEPYPADRERSWLLPTLVLFTGGFLTFTTGTTDWALIDDGLSVLLESMDPSRNGTMQPVRISIVPVPEPGTLALLVLGLVCTGAVHRSRYLFNG